MTDDTISLDEGLYARLETSMGDITLRLFHDKVPQTVANFVALAEGKMPNKVKAEGEPFYDGIIFHRIIKDFMIQTGDPMGDGRGGPGYNFNDEFHPELRHDKKGILSMANAGPNTNGSQFFITHTATPWLDDKHSVFGEVVQGFDVVDEMANVEKDRSDKPKQDIVIRKVQIIRKGDALQTYNAFEVFQAAGEGRGKKQREAEVAQRAEINNKIIQLSEGFTDLGDGLFMRVDEKGLGQALVKGDEVSIDYVAMLADGQVFDSSEGRKPLLFELGAEEIIEGLDRGLESLPRGSKARFVIPPWLAYGAQGYPNVIPPNAILIFDVSILA